MIEYSTVAAKLHSASFTESKAEKAVGQSAAHDASRGLSVELEGGLDFLPAILKRLP